MKNSETTRCNVNSEAVFERAESGCESPSELGQIKIHDNVLAALVSRAVLGVAGVSRLAGSAIIDNLAGMVGSHSRAIEIIKDADDKIKIAVKVNIYYGNVIPQVATNVQQQIIEQVEKAAGLTVAAVDVIVQQLDDPQEDIDDEEESAADKVDAMAASRAALSGLSGMN
jgi:uncharacterized alkaline shock family protein YloU